jgi:hypothetical protein
LGRGIAPEILLEQVKAAAPWALEANIEPATRALAAAEIIPAFREDATHLRYFGLLLAAHYLTVGTFCPTDVDARIRHHAWVEMPSDRVRPAVALVDEAARWDARRVSARTVTLASSTHDEPVEGAPDDRTTSGHDGEWLSVRAGALARAAEENDAALVAALADAIDHEIDREARIFDVLARPGGDPLLALAASTVLAHNAGDLSRVVDAWPKHPALAELRARYTRLGHASPSADGPGRFGRAFVRAGALNKRMMAHENHRFLALRKARALRRSRELLLPFGPWLDDWGERVARALEHDENDVVEVVTALAENHLRGPTEEGCLRALAGIDRARRGGISALVPELPARLRKVISKGAVPAALRIGAAQFLERSRARARTALSEIP